MSIVIRKSGSREYAYEAHRDGARMVQSYIGPLARADVRRRVEAAQRATVIAEHTTRLFPDASVLRLQKDAARIIAVVLERGDLDDMQWLRWAYADSAIVDVVLAGRDLSPRTSNFWNAWFSVSDAS